MKRTDYITILVCLLAIGVVLIVARCPRTVPLEECSEVYKRYKDVEGVRATYVKDYRVNDTLTMGVTLLEATDSAGWEYLLERFKASKDMKQKAATRPESRGVWVRMSLKGHPEEKYKKDPSSNSDQTPELVAISFKTRMIGIFHTGTGEELKAVFCYNTDYMTNRTQNHLKNNKSYEN